MVSLIESLCLTKMNFYYSFYTKNIKNQYLKQNKQSNTIINKINIIKNKLMF
jgi:hypothetical protein